MDSSDTSKIKMDSSETSSSIAPTDLRLVLDAISRLTQSLEAVTVDRNTDKIKLELLQAQIYPPLLSPPAKLPPAPITSPYVKSSPTSNTSQYDPLDHLDDDNNYNYKTNRDVIRKQRQSNYNMAIKHQPTRSSDNKAIQFLYSPISSTLQLKYVTVGTFTNFWREFTKLQQQHPEQSLQLGNFLSLHVIDELIAEQHAFDSTNLTSFVRGHQLNLDNDVIYSMLIKKISPRTKEIFIFELNRNLEFPHLPSGYQVTTAAYKHMYHALLEWVNRFTTLYDILTTDLQSDLPQFRTKNGAVGILDSFLNPIPQQHGHKILKALNYDQIKHMKDIKHEFIHVFMAFVRNIYQQYIAAHDLNLTVGMIPIYNKDRNNIPSPLYNKDRNNIPSPLYNKDRNNIPPHKISSLQHDENTFDFEHYQYSEYAANIDTHSVSQNDDNFYDETYAQSISSLHALTDLKPNLPCFPMMRTGTCTRGSNCSFSHKKEHLLQAWQTMFADLQKSPFNPKLHLTQSSPPLKKQYNITNDVLHLTHDEPNDTISHSENISD